MARAPEASSKSSNSKKTKSSTTRSQTHPKAPSNGTKIKEGPATAAKSAKSSNPDDAAVTSTMPVKSVLTSSTAKAASANVEMDFPRGAPAPVKGLKHDRPVQEEKGLFNDGLQTQPAKSRKDDAAAGAPASTTSKKRKQPPTSSLSNKNKKTAKAASAAAPTSTANADTFRVEHLSYKRLLPGPTTVLVQVVQILPLELIVSLPDQLMANIPITNISKAFRKRLEEEADASSDDESEESEEDEDDDGDASDKESTSERIGKLPNLSDMFYVGQYLRASVSRVLPPRATSTFASSSKQRGNELWKSSRRAELSLEPEVVNEGVSLADLKNGQIVLQGYVKSVEDNGYIVDFGLQLPGASNSGNEQGSNTLTGFVSFKDEEKAKKHAVAAGDSWPKYRATLGGIVSARITKLAENARTCTIGIQQSDVENTLLSAAPGISSLLPGTLVSGSITAITPSGLNVRFLSFFTGSVDIFHMLPSPTPRGKEELLHLCLSAKARLAPHGPPLQ